MAKIFINDEKVEVPDEISVAAAILNAGVNLFRLSLTGEPRAPLCGMGICFECRVKIDGISGQKSCTTAVREGMRIETDEQN